MFACAIPGWSGTNLEFPCPEPWGWFPAMSGLLVFGASLQRHGHALSSSDADRIRGPVTVSDYLQALRGVSKVISGRSPAWVGIYTRPLLPAGGRQFHLLGLGRSCSTRLRCLGYFSPRVAFQGMQEALGKVCYVRPSIKSCLRAGISGSYCLALRQGSLFYFLTFAVALSPVSFNALSAQSHSAPR